VCNPSRAVVTPCVGDRECRQGCQQGYAQTSGTNDHWCQGGTWSGAPAICKRQCGTYGGPRFMRSCIKYLLNDPFAVFAGERAGVSGCHGCTSPQLLFHCPDTIDQCRRVMEPVHRVPADPGRVA